MAVIELGRKIRSAFIVDKLRPQQACTTSKDGGALDERRWDGRSADGWHKQWIEIRKECPKFKSIRDRIVSMDLTGMGALPLMKWIVQHHWSIPNLTTQGVPCMIVLEIPNII